MMIFAPLHRFSFLLYYRLCCHTAQKEELLIPFDLVELRNNRIQMAGAGQMEEKKKVKGRIRWELCSPPAAAVKRLLDTHK